MHPNASWDDVVQALEEVEENAIVKEIRAKFRLKENCCTWRN